MDFTHAKAGFPVGTHQFHEEPNFNYQMNRWTAFGDLPVAVVKKAAQRIQTVSDYCHEFLELGEAALKANDVQRAAYYHRAVDFFLPYDDPRKEAIYDRTVSLLRKLYAVFFDQKRILADYVAYEKGRLPVWFVPAAGSAKQGTILFSGGFDCIKEELVPVLIHCSDRGFDVIYFEGPGQGETLVKEKISMTHQWEKPVTAVLDHFNSDDDITIIGLSLGGYLAPRAAAFEKRIRRVITWGIMDDFFKVVTTRRGIFLEYLVRTFLFLRLSFLLNGIVRLKMKRDGYTHWGVDHGMQVLGVSSPAAYFRKLRNYSLKNSADKVWQDVLLTGGSEDHFVPISHFYKAIQKFKSARSVTGRLFTAAESGENHCQFGNIGLTLEVMMNWIKLQNGKANDG